MKPSRNTVLSWVAWLGALALVTVALHDMRTALQQVHVALLYLLIVLGGSAYGGRGLGFTLALSGFVLLDYFFQAPFDTLSVGTSLDWLVLMAFLATAGVATNLLARAQEATKRAEQRADEVARLSRLGSELLSAGRADDALGAIAESVRETVGADAATVFAIVETGTEVEARTLVSRGTGPLASAELASAAAGRTASRAADIDPWPASGGRPSEGKTTVRWEPIPGDAGTQALLIPLRVHGHSVGLIGLTAAAPVEIRQSQRRFLDALTYYAALAVERVARVTEAEHRDALQEADRLRNALLASVSHDLRTPLSTVKVLAQDTVARAELSTAIINARTIEEQVDRLARLVTNLLDVTRLRGGALPLEPEVNGAEDLIGAVARQVTGVLGAHPLERRVDATGPVLLGRFDFVHTMRILANLIENAARYSPPEAPIVLSARRDGGMLLFEVTDRGAGIPVAERGRVFEAFYRAPGSAPDAGGVGLGLHVARELAEAQGGSLTIVSAGGDGSTFALRLPAEESELADEGFDSTSG